MAQYRQSGFHYGNGSSAIGSDHVAIGIRAGQHNHKQPRHRRLAHKGAAVCKISIGAVVDLGLADYCYGIVFSSYLDHDINTESIIQDDDFKNDFLTNVSRINTSKVKFGHGSVTHGRDSRYWDGDDRRRDDDYNEEVMDKNNKDEAADARRGVKGKNDIKKSHSGKIKGTDHHGFYNEAGRDELKMYEEKYEASLKNVGQTGEEKEANNRVHDDGHLDNQNEEIDVDDEYDDGIDSHDARIEEDENGRHDEVENDLQDSHYEEDRDSSHDAKKTRSMIEEEDGASNESIEDKSKSLNILHNDFGKSKHGHDGEHGATTKKSAHPTSGRKRKHRSSSSCELKFLNTSAQLVEPLENRKFSRFSLQYTGTEKKPDGLSEWEPKFAGHQTLGERENSFMARDQKINCGFVKGPPGSPSTGFDLAEDDSRYISKCHIAVVSCIFGNSDRLRSPASKMVSRLSKKNVCFVMFVDETTMQTLSSEGHMPEMGFIGLWKIVVVKNLPYDDMRRVGKIPKLLPHRLFPSARYSIWLDSKLRLQSDPLLILEYFLWRKGHEYAISNHYDRHCVWEEVAQNKKLNKYNHTIIDQQFAFYQADGLKRFNASDPQKLLPSNVPEGSFIIRAHTPMSNLFSCLWFNEVDRFTPRDQLSFAYTYQKLKKKNPTKPFYIHMFKDCERRKMAKLFHHRSEERHVSSQDATE
ncbi:uncharacterized protein [Phyllobates terribilis]|uniref:uncharacterized protein n=1 Tax=Phyllobates terribilis TaxID=111132 RepID=UPI003CCB01FF